MEVGVLQILGVAVVVDDRGFCVPVGEAPNERDADAVFVGVSVCVMVAEGLGVMGAVTVVDSVALGVTVIVLEGVLEGVPVPVPEPVIVCVTVAVGE